MLNEQSPHANPPLILITGMHRSGTSLLGSILPACGVTMPGPLISGDHNNPEGYFERSDITELQEQLLIDLNRWWPSVNGLQELPNDWLQTTAGQDATDKLQTLLQEEQSRQNGPWAIKDPRTSLLLPLWRQVCNQLNISIKVLLAIRDPLEVSASLVQRDQAYTGMDGWRAQNLWWRHNIQVLRDCDDLPLQVVSFSHWFSPDSARTQIETLFPNCSAEQRQQALAAIRPQHRRSHRRKPTTDIHPTIHALYDVLHAAALQPRSVRDLTRWLDQQKSPPDQPPTRSWVLQLKRRYQMWIQGSDRSRWLEHPWAYFAAMRRGSEPELIRRQIRRWLHAGFTTEELNHAAMLPGSTPQTTAAPSSSGVVNQQTISPGPAGAMHLLRLAEQQEVHDADRERVLLLRQFGINAIWTKN